MDYSDYYCEDAYGYVYITWIINKNSKLDGCYYIGQRLVKSDKKKPNIIYYGSGRKIRNYIKKWGNVGLNRAILNFADDQEELNIMECSMVGDDYYNNPKCLNLCAGGMQGGLSEETKRKISQTLKGCTWTDDRNSKISQTMKSKPKGKHYYNNGIIEKVCYVQPEGFVKGRLHPINDVPPMLGKHHSKETLQKMSKWQSANNPMRGKIWINNGIIAAIISKDSEIPKGFIRGRGNCHIRRNLKIAKENYKK